MLATALAACLLSASRAAAAPKNPDAFVYLDIAEADSLDPAWPIELVSQGVILSIYETLFDFDGPRLVPRLAARVPGRANGLISPDGRTYRIPIRRGVKFSDGAPLTAEDARYSILRFILQDRDGGPSAALLEPLLGVRSTRDGRGVPRADLAARAERAVTTEGDDLVLHLPKPYAPLLAILASKAPVVSRNWAVAHGDWDGSPAAWTRFNNPRKQDSPFFAAANGSGPYRLERWDRTAKELVLVRNDAYRGPPARLRRVVLRVIPEFATRKLLLEGGDADAISADVGNLSRLRGLPGVRLRDDLPSPGIEPVAYFNFRINPQANPFIGSGRLDGDGIPSDFFADKDVRLAFAQAFDYKTFIADVYAGRAVQATGCLPRGILGHNPAQPVFSYDPDAASAHLRKAFGGKLWDRGFRFTLAVNSGNASRRTLAAMYKRSLESLNPKFRVDLREMEWPSYLDAVAARRTPLMIFNLSADYPDPHSIVSDIMQSQGGQASAQGYADPEADRLVAAALAETDLEKRRGLYVRLQKIEHEDVPHLLFVESDAFRVERGWLRGAEYNPLSVNPHFEKLDKEETR